MARKHAGAASSRSRREFLAAASGVGALALAGCTQDGDDGDDGGDGGDGDGGDDSLSGDINIAGSSTVFPLSTAMREAFKEEHGDVSIDIASTGSGAGFSSNFCTGDTDINNASRPITESEEEKCEENGVEWHETKVATDAVTVVVNNDADWIDCLTFDELAQIWGPDAVDTWSEVREEWPDETIDRYGPTPASGTFDYFTEEVVGEAGSHTQEYSATEQDNTIITGVEGSEYAIGYLGFAYYFQNPDRVTGVAVEDEEGNCVEPTLDTAREDEYPLSRPLFIYPAISSLAEEHIAEFCRFFVEQSASTDLVADTVGYVPNTESEMQDELDALNEAIDEAGDA